MAKTPVVMKVADYKDREVQMVTYEFDQETDREGQMTGIPRGGKIRVRVKALNDGTPELVAWMCDRFLNLEALNSYPWIIKIGKSYTEGTRIRAHTEGTLLQLVGRIHLVADNQEQLFERIAKLEELFRVVDEKGDSVILPGHDLEDLKKRINYEL